MSSRYPRGQHHKVGFPEVPVDCSVTASTTQVASVACLQFKRCSGSEQRVVWTTRDGGPVRDVKFDRAGDFLAVTGDAPNWQRTLPDALTELSQTRLEPRRCGDARVWIRGFEVAEGPGGAFVASLSLGPRVDRERATARGLLRGLETGAVVDPPAAVVHWAGGSAPVRAGVDQLGFRQLYQASGPGWAAISSSSRVLAVLTRAPLDLMAVKAQSLLGWQVGDRTLFKGVTTVNAGHSVALRYGELEFTRIHPSPSPAETPGVRAPKVAAALIRDQVAAFVDDYPDAFLQLTGGLDSRILLAAIPQARRRRVAALTIAVPGSPDAALAARLADAFGMRHVVLPSNLALSMDDDAVNHLVGEASRSLDGMADPVGHATLALAEAQHVSTPRLSGLGGEVVRGFYYLGPSLGRRTSAREVRKLATWRLFPNESVSDACLTSDFVRRRQEVVEQLYPLFTQETDWHRATDAFYLQQRMRRWAGVLGTATSMTRVVLNPMLNPQVLAVGEAVPTSLKARAGYLSQILLELDRDLAQVPLDGRPPPVVYAKRSAGSRVLLTSLTLRKAALKARQRLSTGSGSQGVSSRVADAVVASWRKDPRALDRASDCGVVDEGWRAKVLGREVEPTPAEVAFVVNIASAAELSAGWVTPTRADASR